MCGWPIGYGRLPSVVWPIAVRGSWFLEKKEIILASMLINGGVRYGSTCLSTAVLHHVEFSKGPCVFL